MLYFTIPSLDNELAQICGLSLPEANPRVKRSADNSRPFTPSLKQRKCEGFSVKLDVNHFEPEDMTIKVVGNELIVNGKHGERLDDNGIVSREFTRRYELPKDIDLERITSKLSNEGNLMIEPPLKQKEAPKQTVIPITFVENKSFLIRPFCDTVLPHFLAHAGKAELNHFAKKTVMVFTSMPV